MVACLENVVAPLMCTTALVLQHDLGMSTNNGV